MHDTAALAPYGPRERALAKAVAALMGGFLVRVGTRTFALRDAGEEIDDGTDASCEALGDGLFERVPVYTGSDLSKPDRHTWMLVYQGSSPRKALRRALDQMDERDVEFLGMNLAFGAAMQRDPRLAESLRADIRHPEPPAQVIGSPDPGESRG